ncbi:arylsulfatase [Maribellus maritimus]|uniref:arylsulfatase n=1 Tax=Maribellus maritimus TaxID=2870838 RepID=UPI001EE9B3D4|nr:arylsulfatase [Maribellus maritimus]MCG6190442.1 arylsulfatase [Maribellus maritimus]
MNLRNLIFTSIFISILISFGKAQNVSQPNVLLIITDDQGYGDLRINGNPHIQTPVIDQFAKESIRFNKFYVSPVCAPTRSSLMTGRFSLRTGVRDTYNGGATMAPEEITIAEMLKNVGYSTGIFGKWHLGDNYPSRPNDQGFDESVIHLSGGMGQVGDFTTWFQGDSSYFNPVLWHNGMQEKYDGYCTDIFAQQAIKFIENNKEKPFFCYLAFNAPHTPLQVPDEYYQKYKNIDPASGFENDERPFVKMSEQNKEDARKVYAMVENIDDNLAKIFKMLDELRIEKNTIVIFMTDNGPQQIRYVAGMRGRKGSVYRGGVRVPFYLRYPAVFEGDKDIETTTAHIDILPTLAEICGAEIPKDRIIDGKSLLPLINNRRVDWASRPLFFYWTRRYPELYNNISIQEENMKLVGHTDYNADIQNFELFDIEKDPYEQTNLITKEADVAKNLKTKLDEIYQELIHSENILHPPIPVIGTKNENPVVLNRNDADGERGIWSQEEIYGKWHVKILEGNYNIRFKFIKTVKGGGKMTLEAGPVIHQKINITDTDLIEMHNVHFTETEGELIPFYSVAGKNILPFWVEIERIN